MTQEEMMNNLLHYSGRNDYLPDELCEAIDKAIELIEKSLALRGQADRFYDWLFNQIKYIEDAEDYDMATNIVRRNLLYDVEAKFKEIYNNEVI